MAELEATLKAKDNGEKQVSLTPQDSCIIEFSEVNSFCANISLFMTKIREQFFPMIKKVTVNLFEVYQCTLIEEEANRRASEQAANSKGKEMGSEIAKIIKDESKQAPKNLRKFVRNEAKDVVNSEINPKLSKNALRNRRRREKQRGLDYGSE